MLAIVADDREERRRALRDELRRHGHEVLEAATAAAVLAAEPRRPALVVLGWSVGGASGLDVCRAVRAQPEQDEPVVVLVGAQDEVDVADAVAAGAADVWPVEIEGDPGDVRVRLLLAEHYARLQAENLRVGGEFALMRQALDLTGTGFVLTDPQLDDHPIVYANRSFYEMTGYPPEEVLGRNCRFLQGDGTDPEDVRRLGAAIRERRPVTVELVNRKRDGTPFFNEVHVAPVFDARGEVVRFVGVQVDVTAYREQEDRFASEQRARRKAEAEQRRSAFLAAASPTLDAQLNLRSTLESLAALSVPRMADLCVVNSVRGGEVRRVAARAADPGLERLVETLPPASSFDPEGDGAMARVMRTGRAELVAETDEGPVADGPLHELLEARVEAGERRRWMVVPLRARGRTTGAMLLAATSGDRRFEADELRLAEDLALRAGLALDNARLYEEQVDVARTLQRSFLPDALPRIPGLQLAARYRPAETAIEIGGDFYDVATLDGGGATISVGDVTGKGAGAAALTGLARHTLRVARMYESDGPSVLGTLNRVLCQERVDRGRYCTAVIADLHPARDRPGMHVSVVCGGHPAPYVLRGASGAIEVLGGRGTILGWVEDPRLPQADTVLEPGDTLVLFTDGVSAGDDGGPLSDAELRRELERWGDRDVAVLAEQLQLAALRGQLGRPADDVVIVVARAVGEQAGTASAAAA